MSPILIPKNIFFVLFIYLFLYLARFKFDLEPWIVKPNEIILSMTWAINYLDPIVIFFLVKMGGGVKKWVVYNQTSEKWLEILILLWKDENYHLVKFLT